MPSQMVTGLNHITLACHDLPRSIAFYRDTLGMVLRADWPDGAYLETGTLWLCLTRQDAPLALCSDYTHIAFTCDQADFTPLCETIRDAAELWQGNKSEGDSLYFLDPDGHKLELHVGDLQSRLDHYLAAAPTNMVVYD